MKTSDLYEYGSKPNRTAAPRQSSDRLRQALAKLLLITAAAACAALLVFSLFSQIELIKRNDELLELEAQLEEAQESNRRLRIEYEYMQDLDGLENTARGELGMIPFSQLETEPLERDTDISARTGAEG